MREKIYNLCSFIFVLSLFIFLLIGFLIVFIQIFGIFFNKPNLVLEINNLLKIKATYISTISGFAGFFAHYLKK